MSNLPEISNDNPIADALLTTERDRCLAKCCNGFSDVTVELD